MGLNAQDRRLLAAIQDGLPLVPRPFAAVGRTIGQSEGEVIEALRRLQDQGVIRRMGVVVRHHELGYRANAMVVWDVPDERTGEVGRTLAALPFVTLCYRRPRRQPVWPYNLFCMIHGRDRALVEDMIEQATRAGELEDVPGAVLFSRRRFKQRGARYAAAPVRAEVA